MTFNSFDVIFYTLAFLVPGFIFYGVRHTAVPRRPETVEFALLRFLAFSCFNYALWAWLVYLVVKWGFFTEHPVISAAAWFLIIFVSPIGLGLASARVTQRGTQTKILRRLGLRPINPIPTAWDYIFATSEPLWVLVTLQDGSTLAGYWGPNSFASDDPKERDIYVEDIYRVPDSGTWQRVENNAGAWIRGSEIRYVEFGKVVKEESDA